MMGNHKGEINWQSLPVRGAWIEISSTLVFPRRCPSRSPCGERGLKCRCKMPCPFGLQSLPVRGAWIEMMLDCNKSQSERVSLPVRGAWIEIIYPPHRRHRRWGRSPCGERGLK